MNNDPVFPVKTKSGRTVKFTEKMAQYMSDKAKKRGTNGTMNKHAIEEELSKVELLISQFEDQIKNLTPKQTKSKGENATVYNEQHSSLLGALQHPHQITSSPGALQRDTPLYTTQYVVPSQIYIQCASIHNTSGCLNAYDTSGCLGTYNASGCLSTYDTAGCLSTYDTSKCHSTYDAS